MIISIDPGISGCVSVLGNNGELIDWIAMPVLKVGSKNRVNAAALSAWVANYSDSRKCFIEKVGAMPGQGVSSMFSFGHSAGVIEGVVAGLMIPIEFITPQCWKKFHGLTGTDKDAARGLAIHLYPYCRDLDTKSKGQALADSILIGLCGMAKS